MLINQENITKEMFYGATPEIFRRASELRKRMTPAEKNLWAALRRKQIKGKRFRRQHPVKTFIVDFYCHEHKLVVEVDGGIHDTPEQKEYDKGRTWELEQLGLKVIRFNNAEVLQNIEDVVEKIGESLDYPSALTSTSSVWASPLQGENGTE